jgi:hypothetical protein
MSDVKSSPQYQVYHEQVVEACAKLMGEQVRDFFDKQCDYLEEFMEGADPEEVAQAQYDAVT